VPEPETVRAPMFRRAIGTARNSFVIQENEAGAQRPGSARGGPPLHLHRAEDEAWYVLEGTLRFRFGEREFDAEKGGGVFLPHGTPHTFWNPGARPARYLLIMGPRTAGLLEALHGPNRPAPDGMKALYDSFDVDLLE